MSIRIKKHDTGPSSKKSGKLSAVRTTVLFFTTAILIGALLLSLPVSSKSGEGTDFLTSLFTAVSANCVTGLVRLDTAIHWSLFGQSVILLLIQLGGIGYMSLTVLLLSSLRRRVPLASQIGAADSVGIGETGGIIGFVKRIIALVAGFELAGAFLLAFRFVPLFGFGKGIFVSLFLSVSAFCNAGFDVLGTEFGEFSSLSHFATDYYVIIIISLLIIIGGIGFIIWDDFIKKIRTGKRLSTYSRFVLVITAILLVSGCVLFMISEWNNTDTIGNYSIPEKIVSSFFQSVTSRTAGFSSLDLQNSGILTKVGFIFFMFIGGASGSTAGGIKVSTFGVLVLAIFATLRGRRNTVVMKRRIPQEVVNQALVIFILEMFICGIASLILVGQGNGVVDSFFECTSAIATVGLSLGITGELNIVSEITVILLMFIGRVGILTIAHSLKKRLSNTGYEPEYAKTNILIG